MDYRNLGRSGLKVSPLCLGTMNFGGPTDAATAERIIARAREAGVNFLDTADAYTGGQFGDGGRPGHCRGSRDLGAGDQAGQTRWRRVRMAVACPRKWVMRAVEASLRRLGTDYVDIYYLHKEDHATPLAETVRAMGDLVRQGKIRYFGVSNYRSWRGGGDLLAVRLARHRPADREPTLLPRAQPPDGDGASAGLWLLRARRGHLQPAGPRHPDRQIRPGCAAPCGHAGGTAGQADAADGMAPRVVADGAGDQPPRAGKGRDGEPVRRRLGAEQSPGDGCDRRPADGGAVGGLPRRADLQIRCR